mmetsp:Transcript_3159/g.7490  ORF Transcript_3159/g.7490 Transcript_3159/m.7490 type:complete len:840 (-) Transcript_3159:119-2638(-)
MMTCGEYDFDFLLCRPSLPPPDVVVDKSAFNDLPIEERLSITQRELEQMKQALRLKESEMEDSQHELKFHAIKNEELMDVINAFRSSSTDRSHEIMRAKAEQNSELTVQVHSLRDLLTKSGDQIAVLQKQLAQKSKVEAKMASHERTQQRLQVQLNGLVKTLDNVEIKSVDIPSEWINLQWITGGSHKKAEKEDSDKVIQDITQKIITMEADRQRLIKESSLYKQGDGEKEDKILALEREVRKMKHDQDELKDTNKSFRQQLEVREGKIGALEELFQSINANRNIVANNEASSPNRLDSLLNTEDEDNEDDCESVDIDSLGGGDNEQAPAQSFEDMFTSIWTSFTGTPSTKKVEETSNADEDQEISSCLNDSYHTKQVEEELQVAAKAEADELRGSHRVLAEDYEVALYKISDLTAKLEEATIKANSFKTKAGLREKLLKDVIQQYKELQMENSSCKERMEQLKQKVAVLLQLEKQRHAERKAEEAAAAAADTGKVVVKGPTVEESPTFEMSERTRMTTEEDGTEDPSVYNGFDKNFIMEDYKRLQGECDQLQHEFDSAIEKINDLEESLQEAKDEVTKYQSFHADQARTIVLLEGEKATLQDRVIEATTKIVGTQSDNNQAEDELTQSKLRYKKAREKQIEREKDLWDVIEQYKKLADQNRSTEEKKAEVEHELKDVEHELRLTNKLQIQRRDLVYEYRKLEKAMEEAVQTGEELAQELQRARSEAAVNKEEAKGIRKRLAGCHFHYKELQEHYDQLLKVNEENERELVKAEKYEGLYNAKEESWALMLDSIREKNRVAEEKAGLAEEKAMSLGKEKEQLQLLCDRLQAEMKLLPAEA